MARSRLYVGHKVGRGEIFRSKFTPTERTHGERFAAVTGPFVTLTGAKCLLWYGNNNPHVRCVSEAERVGRLYKKELAVLGKVRDVSLRELG